MEAAKVSALFNGTYIDAYRRAKSSFPAFHFLSSRDCFKLNCPRLPPSPTSLHPQFQISVHRTAAMAHKHLMTTISLFLLFFTTLCNAQLPPCGELKVCYAIDNLFYDPDMYDDLLRSAGTLSRSISSQFSPVSFIVGGIVGRNPIIRQYNYSLSILGGGDSLSDFRTGLSNTTVNSQGSQYSLRLATTLCDQQLRNENAVKVIVMLTDKHLSSDLSNLFNGILDIKDTFVFSLKTERAKENGLVAVTSVYSSQMNSFKQIKTRPRLSASRVGDKWNAVTQDFFEPYLVDLASRNCTVNAPPPRSIAVPFGGNNKLVTQQLITELDALPFGQPRITKAADLPVFNASQTRAQSAVNVRNSLEFLVFEQVRLTDPTIELKSVVGITQRSFFTSRMAKVVQPTDVELIKNACESNRCAAKVLMDFTKSVKRREVELATDELRKREGFRDQFIGKPWAINSRKRDGVGKKWEVDFIYRVRKNPPSNPDR